MIKDNLLTLLDWWKTSAILQKKSSKSLFKEGEIWWASIGMNIGTEIFGKGAQFERPVVIFRKFNPDSFLGIPLTTKLKQDEWRVFVAHNGIKRAAILSQARTLDGKRLTERIGALAEEEFQKIKTEFIRCYNLEKPLKNPHSTDACVVECSGKPQ